MFAAQDGSTPNGKLYVDDVFSTYLYTGNGSAQTINNGIDLAGKGGLVWMKCRSTAYSPGHNLYDSARTNGRTHKLATDVTDAENGDSGITLNSSGFALVAGSTNYSGQHYASWAFRKAPKFFDVVTYTGNGANRTIAHSLGAEPGMIIVKRTDATADWQVYHRWGTGLDYLVLNSTAPVASGSTRWNGTKPTSSVFSVGADTTVNTSGGSYVAYLFAHDPSAGGIIQCGSFTTDASNKATVNLGWEPQYLLFKRATGGTGNWIVVDSMRGMTADSTSLDPYIHPNLSRAEQTNSYFGYPTSTGFKVTNLDASCTYIYLAIRRPNKPPTSGAEVFQPVVYTGTNVDNRLVDTGIVTDLAIVRQRNDAVLAGMVVGDRLRGGPYLRTGSTNAENTDADSFMTPTVGYGNAFSAMNGFGVGDDATSKLNINTTANNHVALAFKRAPGVFDEVCYTGDGFNQTITHGLDVVPELMISKGRSVISEWAVTTASQIGALQATREFSNLSTDFSKTTVVVNANHGNNPGETYVAYLFASLPGVSKVGNYTGNGSSQTINCGFTTGARFILIKRTDSTGDWYVWDSARGIVAATDPRLSLNTTAAEVATDDSVDPDASGFIVNQVAATNINVSGGSYIFLAIA